MSNDAFATHLDQNDRMMRIGSGAERKPQSHDHKAQRVDPDSCLS